MSNKDGFLDSLKHMVFEEEPEASKSPVSSSKDAPPPHVPVAPVVVPSMSAGAPAVSVEEDSEVYRMILAKTEFDKTEVGAAVRRFLDPLDGLPMDPSLKFKTAVAQARAQLGLTEDAIFSAFDGLTLTLQREQEAFAGKEQQFKAKEIDGRQQRISDITAQMQQLQKELSELSSDLMEAQNKAASAHGKFVAAIQRRANEIEQQKAQFAALLK